MPFFPLDSAMICSIQCAKADKGASARIVSLSRPARAPSPITAPSASPGLRAAGTCAPHCCFIQLARSRNRSRSRPIKAAGTMPKSVSAEKRPPTLSSEEKIFRKVFFRASASSEVPGSVVATKRDPSPLLNAQK